MEESKSELQLNLERTNEEVAAASTVSRERTEELEAGLRGARAKASALEIEMKGLRQKQEGKAASILSLCWKLARTQARLSTLEKENSGLKKALEEDAEALDDEEGQISAFKAENVRLKLSVEAARKAAGKEGEVRATKHCKTSRCRVYTHR